MNFPSNTENPKDPVTQIQDVKSSPNGTYVSFVRFVYGNTNVYVDGLRHYTYYDLTVRACREAIENDTESLCSKTSVATKRTLKKQGADDIHNLRLINTTEDSATIGWDIPENPNGVIQYYLIEYKRIDMTGITRVCITNEDFKSNSSFYTIKRLSGNYTVSIWAKTSADYGPESEKLEFYVQETNRLWLYFLIASFIILICIVAAMLYWKKHLKDREMRLIPTVNPEYVSSKYVPDEWEVPREKIKLIKELGQGSFGMVYEGEARNIRGIPFMKCAVKTVNEHATNSERMEFLNEASVMKAFDTAHVVRLLGVVSKTEPTLVIMELMAKEDLKTYLRLHRPDAETVDPKSRRQPPSLKRIYQMAIEIADGMSYLAAKKFVHRDLAARNCMVAEDLTVKIGDFGMTRDIYETDYYRKGTKGFLPVRWMAPESLRDGVFTSSSDTWSYGVVLWEMATLASQPYQGLTNDQVLRFVIDGGVMERPENCPDKLYDLMKLCWRPLPSERPTFLKICSLLLDDASSEFVKVSFYHSAAGIEARNSRPTPSPSQDDQTTPLNEFHDLDSDDDSEHPAMNSGNRISFPTANGFGIPTNGAATTQC